MIRQDRIRREQQTCTRSGIGPPFHVPPAEFEDVLYGSRAEEEIDS